MQEDIDQVLELWNDIELDDATLMAPHFDPQVFESKEEVLTLNTNQLDQE